MSGDQQVTVAIYDSKYGVDVRVFQTEGQAYRWRTEIAKAEWSVEYDGPTPSDNVIGDEYFEIAASNMDYFSTYTALIEEA
jgi:hypothetical protein